MTNIFRVLGNRLAAMFATHVALDFEKQFLSLQSDRKAELLLKADQLDEQGLESLAAELREQALELSHQTPMASTNATFGDFGNAEILATVVAEPARIESKVPSKTTTRKTSRKRKVAKRR